MVKVKLDRQAFLELIDEYADYINNYGICIECADYLRLFSRFPDSNIITYPFKNYEITYSDGEALFCLSKEQLSDITHYVNNLQVDSFHITFSDRRLIVGNLEFFKN
jgi:hypothetical protein